MSRARKQDRFSSTLAVSYREPTSSEPSLGTCSDISPSGMFIETPRPAARGVLVRFECVSQSTQGVVRGTARVMWLRPHNEAQGKSGMGVRFVRLEPGSARVIEELIAHASSAGSRTQSDGPEARATHEEPSVVLTAERTIGPTNRSSSVPPKGLRAPTLRGLRPTDVHSSRDVPSVSSAPPAAPKERKTFDSGPPRNLRDVKGRSSAPPPERVQETAPDQPSSRPPGDKASSHSQALRDRRERARRPDETPTDSERAAAAPPVDDRTTAPDGSVFTPQRDKEIAPIKSLGATIHDTSQPNKLSAGSGPRRGSDTAMGVPSPPPPQWKARHSERAPEPGGVEVIRAVHVTAEEQAAANAAAARAATASNGGPDEASVNAELPGANDPPLSDWEPMVEPQRPAMRPDRAPPNISMPYLLPATSDETSAAKPTRNWIPWIVVGSGILVTFVLIAALGGIKLRLSSTPVKTDPDPNAAPQLSAENTFAPREEEPAADSQKVVPTQLVVTSNVEPFGAIVSAQGTTITSPGKLSFPIDMVQWPLRVKVAMPGYGATEVSLQRYVFVAEGDTLKYDLHLTLQRVPQAGTTPSAPVAAEPDPEPSKPEPRRSGSSHASKSAKSPAAPSAAASNRPSAPPAPSEPAASEPSGKSAFDRALECLSRGDNACVISTLSSASGARELDLLIETYRATGDSSSAEAAMRRYLQLHADGKRASQYRRALGMSTTD